MHGEAKTDRTQTRNTQTDTHASPIHADPHLNFVGWDREFNLEESTAEGCYPLVATVTLVALAEYEGDTKRTTRGARTVDYLKLLSGPSLKVTHISMYICIYICIVTYIYVGCACRVRGGHEVNDPRRAHCRLPQTAVGAKPKADIYLCIYVYMYIYICIYMYIYAYVYIVKYIYLYISIHLSIYISIHTYIYKRTVYLKLLSGLSL